MLGENIKNLRTARSMTQADLADRLHVVRQTVSKWEKGLSVPDAECLTRLAEALGTTVSTLLGETIPPPAVDAPTLSELAEKLEALNAEFVRRAEPRRRSWRIAFLLFGLLAIPCFFFALITALPPSLLFRGFTHDVSIIGGADGPTTILISDISPRPWVGPVLSGLVILLCVIGIIKTRKK